MTKKNTISKIIICSVIFLCTFSAHAASLPPDPNNASLLYYQAFLVLPEPDYFANEFINKSTTEKIYEYLKGAKLDPDPEEEIKEMEKSIHELELKMKGISPDPNKQLSPYERTIFTGKHFKEQRLDGLDFLKESLNHQKKMKGVDPNKVIREYLKKCGSSIALVQAASEITDCDWGIRYSQGYSFQLPQMVEIRKLMFVLRADAVRLAADGHYRAALERCLMMRRLALHVGDDTIHLYAVSKSVDGSTIRCIQFILGCMKPDLEILKWLNYQLATIQGVPSSPLKALRMDFELAMHTLRINDKILKHIRHELTEQVSDESAKKEVLDLSDEQILTRARKPYQKFMNRSFQVMNGSMLYEDKRAKIQKMTDELINEHSNDPAANQIIMACAEQVLKLYTLQVSDAARLNALRLAVEIYYIYAKTDKLPEILPKGLLKDPYTGKDFQYRITEEGFVLGFDPEKIADFRVRQFNFKVKE
jgi:hypothetical protein